MKKRHENAEKKRWLAIDWEIEPTGWFSIYLQVPAQNNDKSNKVEFECAFLDILEVHIWSKEDGSYLVKQT